ncbi:MAG: tetratricopeptide repeat protein [Gemmatimonadota bacterium]
MARKRPSNSKNQPPRSGAAVSGEDAIAATVLEWTVRARQNTQLLIAGAVVLVVVFFGLIYLVNQRSDRLTRAAAELEQVRAAASFLPAQDARNELRAYIGRFEGTPQALESYLMLAELHLHESQPDSAIAVLQEIVPEYGSPLEVQATFLLATAFEEAGRWTDAAALYEALMAQARFSFQEEEAAEGLARAHIARGDRAAAIAAYESLLALLEPDDPDRARYEMRRAELEAQAL